MAFMVWLVADAVVGLIAAAIMRERLGPDGTVFVGVAGAFLGGAILSHNDIARSPLTGGTFAVSIVAAIVLLALVKLVRRGLEWHAQKVHEQAEHELAGRKLTGQTLAH